LASDLLLVRDRAWVAWCRHHSDRWQPLVALSGACRAWATAGV